MPKKEREWMSLQEAISFQEEKFPLEYCFECKTPNSMEIVKVQHEMYGITVFDFPKYRCKNCGEISHRLNVAAAIERLQEKHHLHGGWYISDLLELEGKN